MGTGALRGALGCGVCSTMSVPSNCRLVELCRLINGLSTAWLGWRVLGIVLHAFFESKYASMDIVVKVEEGERADAYVVSYLRTTTTIACPCPPPLLALTLNAKDGRSH